jgi:hypothetical protein
MPFKIQILGAKRLERQFARLPSQTTKELGKAVNASLLMVQNEARRSIQKGPKSGRVYKKGGVTHQASAPGQAPATDTGHLVSHVNHKQQGLRGTVGIHELKQVKYARRLEFGGRDKRGVYIAPRPFLRPAYKKMQKKIAKRLARVLPDSLRRALGG